MENIGFFIWATMLIWDLVKTIYVDKFSFSFLNFLIHLNFSFLKSKKKKRDYNLPVWSVKYFTLYGYNGFQLREIINVLML